MPTSPLSTVIPLRRATRARLEELREQRTFDATLREILDALPPAALLGQPAEPSRVTPEPADRRSPAKQLLLARLAEAAWRERVARGEIERVGERMVVWSSPSRVEEVPRVVRERRRGLPP